jgi:hypothetical protein
MKKIRTVLLLISLLLVSSSCSQYHYVQSDLYFENFEGKGKHVVVISVDDSNTNDESLTSVQSKILPIMKANKPISDMEINSWIENKVLYFSMTYTFNNLAEFETKAELITGNDYTFTKTQNTDLFMKEINFSGLDLNERNFSYWAIKAIDDANIFSFDGLVNSTNGKGSYIYFNDQIVNDDYGSFALYDIWKIKGISIESSLSKSKVIKREIKFILDSVNANAGQIALINDNTITQFFQAKADSFLGSETFKVTKVQQENLEGVAEFTLSFSSTLPDEIANMTQKMILGLDVNVAFSEDETSKLVMWSESYDTSEYVSYSSILDTPIHYVLKLGDYRIKTVDDEAYIKDGTYDFVVDKNTITMDANAIRVDLGLKYDATREMMLILLALLGVAALVALGTFFYYKKNPDKMKAIKEKRALLKEQKAQKVSEAATPQVIDIPDDNQYRIVEIAEDSVVIKNPSIEGSIIVTMENAYENPQLDDKVDYFTDGESHYIQKR